MDRINMHAMLIWRHICVTVVSVGAGERVFAIMDREPSIHTEGYVMSCHVTSRERANPHVLIDRCMYGWAT